MRQQDNETTQIPEIKVRAQGRPNRLDFGWLRNTKPIERSCERKKIFPQGQQTIMSLKIIVQLLAG